MFIIIIKFIMIMIHIYVVKCVNKLMNKNHRESDKGE